MTRCLLTLIIVACFLSAYSQEIIKSNGFRFKPIGSNELELVGIDSAWKGTYEIPEMVEGRPVVSLGYFSFYKYDKSKTLYIPKSIVKLEDYYGVSKCFNRMKCDTVIIDANIDFIPRFAFVGCKNLKYVRLPETLVKIADEVFKECRSLEYMYIPEGIKEIGDGAFGDYPIGKFPDSLRVLGRFNAIASEYLIPERIDKITPTFGCPNIKRIDVEKGNKNYSSYEGVLMDKEMKKIIRYPNKKDKKFEVPNSVEEILDYAFMNNKNLKCVVIGENIKHIGNQSFWGCDNLKTIKIRNSGYVFFEEICEFDSHLKDLYIGEKFSCRDNILGWEGNIHIMRGGKEIKCIKAYDYVNPKPSIEKYTNTISKDSLRAHLEKIKSVPSGYETLLCGDFYYWEAVKCGKEIIPDLIDLLADTTSTNVIHKWEGCGTKRNKIIRLRINEVSFSVLFGIVHVYLSNIYEDFEDTSVLELENFITFEEKPDADLNELCRKMKEWYALHSDKLYWRHSIEKYNTVHPSFGYKEPVHPAGGWYEFKSWYECIIEP